MGLKHLFVTEYWHEMYFDDLEKLLHITFANQVTPWS